MICYSKQLVRLHKCLIKYYIERQVFVHGRADGQGGRVSIRGRRGRPAGQARTMKRKLLQVEKRVPMKTNIIVVACVPYQMMLL